MENIDRKLHVYSATLLCSLSLFRRSVQMWNFVLNSFAENTQVSLFHSWAVLRANLYWVCPVIWHSRWELVQISCENFSQPLPLLCCHLLCIWHWWYWYWWCNIGIHIVIFSVYGVDIGIAKLHPVARTDMQLKERDGSRYRSHAIRWNCDAQSNHKTLHVRIIPMHKTVCPSWFT